ncbi:MAG: hypothetical protein ACI4JY_06560 [Oscillospiraceae bacterium]
MKRIVAFVLLALMIYAGGFFVVYGFRELEVANSRPLSLDMVGSETLRNGQTVEGVVYQQIRQLGEDTIQSEILGIPVGEPVKRRFYLVPLRYEKERKDIKYYAVCISGEKNIEEFERIKRNSPQMETGDGYRLKGVACEMTPGMKNTIYDVLSGSPYLVGVDGFLRNPLPQYYYNRILPWTVYERNELGSAWICVILGAVLFVGGVIPSVILGVKIYREKHW